MISFCSLPVVFLMSLPILVYRSGGRSSLSNNDKTKIRSKWMWCAEYFNVVKWNKKLKKLMEQAGLEAIHYWNPRRQTHRDYFDMSQAKTCDIPISLNLEGFKKND